MISLKTLGLFVTINEYTHSNSAIFNCTICSNMYLLSLAFYRDYIAIWPFLFVPIQSTDNVTLKSTTFNKLSMQSN